MNWVLLHNTIQTNVIKTNTTQYKQNAHSVLQETFYQNLFLSSNIILTCFQDLFIANNIYLQ